MRVSTEAALERVIVAYEGLQPDSIDALLACYAEGAHFKDPFNDVRGRAAIGRIFRHMFVQVDAPRFRVTQRFVAGGDAMLCWEFHLRFRGQAQARVIAGATALRFDAQGLIGVHRDYWDAGELYAQLPLFGPLVRWLRGRLSA